MPKLENAHLIQIELEEGRAKISLSEYDLSRTNGTVGERTLSHSFAGKGSYPMRFST